MVHLKILLIGPTPHYQNNPNLWAHNITILQPSSFSNSIHYGYGLEYQSTITAPNTRSQNSHEEHQGTNNSNNYLTNDSTSTAVINHSDEQLEKIMQADGIQTDSKTLTSHAVVVSDTSTVDVRKLY